MQWKNNSKDAKICPSLSLDSGGKVNRMLGHICMHKSSVYHIKVQMEMLMFSIWSI